ncbi:MAG: hypothetical protein C4547_16200 [Phycisphaerales bacterium]|nr:MAG: hypothetical protein C4547_16200 [Phycisphaerales bacterium]
MASALQQLDDLLRGRKTAPEQLAEGRVDLPLGVFVPLAVGLGAVYGFFMGWYALFSRDPASLWQLMASTVKLPALFFVTLVVTLPSLYVFNALVGCRLSLTATVRLLVAAIAVNVTVAASLAPILGFFTFSTTSYSFMILLNVALLTISGIVGLAFLLHTLRRLAMASGPLPRAALAHPSPKPPPTAHPPTGAVGPAGTGVTGGPSAASPAAPAAGAPSGSPPAGPSSVSPLGGPPSGSPPASPPPGVLDRLPNHDDEALGSARSIFRIWMIIYGLVGAQTGWLLRPFIGTPDLPFQWFRPRGEGNFFLAVARQLRNLLGGG